MLLWLLLAAMTGLAAFTLLWPLARIAAVAPARGPYYTEYSFRENGEKVQNRRHSLDRARERWGRFWAMLFRWKKDLVLSSERAVCG